MSEPLFFASDSQTPLLGIWRAPAGRAGRVWVICPPFAEEEKSARRTLTEIAEALRRRGEASLIFSYRGTGDSGGDFADATLRDWREDIAAACRQTRLLAPGASLALLGVRLGASLALGLRATVQAELCVLIEPIVNGRRYLAQMGQRKRLRSMLTQADGQNVAAAVSLATLSVAPVAIDPLSPAAASNPEIEDLDGWPLGAALRADLEALDLQSEPADPTPPAAAAQLLQVGPREQIAAPLARLGDRIGAAPRAVLLQPFWNQLDYVRPEPLLEALGLAEAAPPPVVAPQSEIRNPKSEIRNPKFPERPLVLTNATGRQLIGVWHDTRRPDAAHRPAVVMLHGWSGYRTGPHQMLTRAARRFAGAGFGVLRFDFEGRGDSQGEAEHATLATMAGDARVALRWCREQGHEAVVLVGLCSGCEVALAVAALASDAVGAAGVSAMALWSAPVFAASAEPARTARKRGHHLRQYARKLLRPASYAKLLGGRLDTRSIGRVLTQGGGGESKNQESDLPGHLPPDWRRAVLERYARFRAPLLLVYGTADPLAAEALKWHRAHAGLPPRVLEVAGANHSYYGLAWEREVIETTLQWLDRQHPA